MSELVDGIDATLQARSRDEWGAIFDEQGVIWGPVLGLHEVPADPQAQSLGLFPAIEHPELGPYSTVNAPMRFHQAEVRPRGPAPQLGEHTRSTLADLGLGETETQALFDQGVVK